MDNNRIEITRPFFPPREELDEYFDQIYKNQWLTNDGPLVKKLEAELKNYFNVGHLALVSSCTMALQIVLEMLPEKGEVITTPFSFIATSSAIQWQGHIPVFADIDPVTFNIDPETIVPLINKNTKAILATHVFGNPCEIERLETIAKEYNIALIFDAAHCFGVKYKGESILSYGDFSCISFHATKLFHTVEGGAIVCNKKNDKEVRLRRNFGFNGPYTFDAIGINGKMSEFHAAMGLANFKYVNIILTKYKKLYLKYRESLSNNGYSFQKIRENTRYNYSYFPILFDSESDLLNSIDLLNNQGIFPRRYFYPALNTLNFSSVDEKNDLINIASKVLCLPLYYSINEKEQKKVIQNLIKS